MALRRAWCSPGADRHGRPSGWVPCFAPVQIAAAVETGEENSKPPFEHDGRMRQLPAARNGLIEIDLGNRRRIRVDAQFDPEALARVLDVLERR